MGFSISSAQSEIYSNKSLPHETRETQNKQPKLTHKQLERRTPPPENKHTHTKTQKNPAASSTVGEKDLKLG